MHTVSVLIAQKSDGITNKHDEGMRTCQLIPARGFALEIGFIRLSNNSCPRFANEYYTQARVEAS
jgi:hypothetical protein